MKMHRYTFFLRILYLSIVVSLLIGTVHIAVGTASANETESSNKLVYVIPIKQTIESGLEQFLKRAIQDAHESGADHIIFEVNTFGGRVDSAENIGNLIRSSSIPTVVYVEGKAISAGSYIALNADQIVMQNGSSIGSAAVVDISGNQIGKSVV